MGVLSQENQDQVKKYLVEEGFIKEAEVEDIIKRASEAKKTFFQYLQDEKIITDEALTRLMAKAPAHRST